MSLKGSESYIWNTQVPLGHGATSSVYLGRNKKSGAEVAVKVFSPQAMMRSASVQLRECDVLRKLKKHDNIVQLLAVEEETDTRLKILVMELCSSSLQDLLSEPQNCFGLSEDEFLLVLQHITDGIRYLRENEVIHRDIKPGNILRHQCSDGRILYKLTDFGAARELEDEERFMSLYGTEEYLHPDLYQRAVLREPTGQSFDYKVDMWSLGVTLYHTATGQLPFRAFGGRKNKESMYKILMEKESGVISGVQRSEGGEIQWNRDLPCTCKLSKSLQFHLVNILAGLLEKDSQKIWNYEKYFREVRNFLSKKAIHVFIPSIWECQRIYSQADNNLEKLKDDINQLFNFLPDHQSYYFEGHPLCTIADKSVKLGDYPTRISDTNPLFILNMFSWDHCSHSKFNVPFFPRLASESNIDTDYSVARSCSTICHQILRTIVGCHHKQFLLQQCMQMILCHYENRLLQFKKRLAQMEQQFDSSRSILSLVKNTLKPFTTALSSHKMPNHTRECQNSSVDFCDGDRSIQEIDLHIHRCEISLDKRLEELEEIKRSIWIDDVCCQNKHRCETKIRLITSTVTGIYEKMKQNRKCKTWHPNDWQIHLLERSQLQAECSKASTLFSDQCCKRSTDHWKSFTAWMSLAIQRKRYGDCLEEDLEFISTKLQDCEKDIQNCFLQLRDEKLNHFVSECGSSVGNENCLSQQTPPDSEEYNSGAESFVAVSMDTGEKQCSTILQTSRSRLDETYRILTENNQLLERFENSRLAPSHFSKR